MAKTLKEHLTDSFDDFMEAFIARYEAMTDEEYLVHMVNRVREIDRFMLSEPRPPKYLLDMNRKCRAAHVRKIGWMLKEGLTKQEVSDRVREAERSEGASPN